MGRRRTLPSCTSFTVVAAEVARWRRRQQQRCLSAAFIVVACPRRPSGAAEKCIEFDVKGWIRNWTAGWPPPPPPPPIEPGGRLPLQFYYYLAVLCDKFRLQSLRNHWEVKALPACLPVRTCVSLCWSKASIYPLPLYFSQGKFMIRGYIIAT